MKQFFLVGIAVLIVIGGVIYFLWRLALTLYNDWQLTRDFDEIRAASRVRREERLKQESERLSKGCDHQWVGEDEGFPPSTCRKCGLQRQPPDGPCDHVWRPIGGLVPGTECERCGVRHAGGALYGGRSM